jgi:GNAT superfamily N-acetyltransferase
MATPSTVRIAKQGDRQEVWRLLLQSHRENGQFALAPDKVDWLVSRALQPELIPEWDTGARPVIGVIGDVGALEAIALISADSFWYSHERHISEYLVFVDPECRKSNHARAMIEWMKRQSDNTGLPLLTGIISTERTEAKVRLYRRMVPFIGCFFLYRKAA